MSASPICPQCGYVNAPGARFCLKCGTALAIAAQPQAPAAPYQSSPGYQAPPQYNYAAVAAQDRAREVDRTRTGLLLLLIGVLLQPVPYVGIIGGIIVLIGAILVIIGRKAFGPAHARNTILSIVIFVVGIAVTIAGSVVFALTVASAVIANRTAPGTVNTVALGQALSSSFNLLLVLAAIGGAISGIAELLFTYAIQKDIGRALLSLGYATGIVISIINIIIIGPLISNAVSQSFTGTTFDPTPFNNLQSQLRVLGLLAFIPAIIYGTAIYLAWSRVKSGEIPGPVAQPNPMVTP